MTTLPDAPRPAATLITMRRPHAAAPTQVLMLVRGAAMRFAGGACVFPGGGVDPADRALAATLPLPPGWDGLEDLAARIAAMRETLEETGLAIGFVRRDGAAITRDEAALARATLAQTVALEPMLDNMGWRIEPGTLTPLPAGCRACRVPMIRASIWPIWARARSRFPPTRAKVKRCSGSPRKKLWSALIQVISRSSSPHGAIWSAWPSSRISPRPAPMR
jgi:8-oxo-dGTP pyrophosphatase MutT (NUDIX family)